MARPVVVRGAHARWSACGSSSQSPTAPSAPPAGFAAQFDSLWATFDRQDSYFDYNGKSTGTPCGRRFVPRALAATDQPRFIGVIREMLAHLHDTHVVLRDPGGAVMATYDAQPFVNWDRAVWQQYIARANWTEAG